MFDILRIKVLNRYANLTSRLTDWLRDIYWKQLIRWIYNRIKNTGLKSTDIKWYLTHTLVDLIK